MSDTGVTRPRRLMIPGGAHAVVLSAGLSLGLLTNWWVALGAVVVGLLVLWRPFDPVMAMALTACAASFANNEGGHLTRDLSVVAILGAYTVLCILAAHRAGHWTLPATPMTWALLILGVVLALGAVHGILAGNSPRFMGLEAIPLLAFSAALAIGGLRPERRRLTPALVLFLIVGVSHFALGVYAYRIFGIRTGGLYFTPFTALMALVGLNLLLFDPDRRMKPLLWLLTSIFLLHQLISFARGYWLGLLVAVAYSCVVYARWGAGSLARWWRVGRLFASMAALLVVAAPILALIFGWSDLPTLLGTRFVSSVGTGPSSETASNLVRLVEYGGALRVIAQAPWFGKGLGYVLHVREPLSSLITSQWFVHQTYLWAWLKLGILGLGALVLVLGTAIRGGTRGALRLSGEAAGWNAAAAAATIHMAVVGLTNYSLIMVNGTVLLAVLWGVAIAWTRPDGWRIVWRARQPIPPAAAPAGGSS
jgi:O-Antigen ligase